MRGKFDRHLYCCTEADLAVRSESALRPPFFFVHYPLLHSCLLSLLCKTLVTSPRKDLVLGRDGGIGT